MRTILDCGWHVWVACVMGVCASIGFFHWGESGFKYDPRWLPTLLIVVDVAAAAGYGISGGLTEWRKIVYWLAAATLTWTVTW